LISKEHEYKGMNKKNILIIEDNIRQRQAIVATCMRAGFAATEAADGESGLEKALREHPDLVILDLLLPKKDGTQFLSRLRKDPWGKSAKVIILSNVSETERVAEAMEHQAFDYFVKSDISLDALITAIKARLGMAQGDTETT
jgi:DNA-binding response OmpR family regulator